MLTTDFIKEIHFSDTEEMFHELSPFGKYKDVLENFVFRGESSASYKLLPSALREKNKDKLYLLSHIEKPIENQSELEFWQQKAEFHLLKRFFDIADERGIFTPEISFLRDNALHIFPHIGENQLSSNWIPDELLELAALAQHYGVPTRLLDWSLSHMASLYFAAAGVLHGASNEEDDQMVLWALNYTEIEFLKNTVSRVPIRLIKPSYYRNPNLFAQKGVLSCWNYKTYTSMSIPFNFQATVNRTPFDELLASYVLENEINLQRSDSSYTVLLYKFHLPAGEATKLYKALTTLGYGADRIFSGLNGVFHRMKDDSRYIEKVNSKNTQ